MSLIYLHQDKFLEHVLLLAHCLQGALEERNAKLVFLGNFILLV